MVKFTEMPFKAFLLIFLLNSEIFCQSISALYLSYYLLRILSWSALAYYLSFFRQHYEVSDIIPILQMRKQTIRDSPLLSQEEVGPVFGSDLSATPAFRIH